MLIMGSAFCGGKRHQDGWVHSPEDSRYQNFEEKMHVDLASKQAIRWSGSEPYTRGAAMPLVCAQAHTLSRFMSWEFTPKCRPSSGPLLFSFLLFLIICCVLTSILRFHTSPCTGLGLCWLALKDRLTINRLCGCPMRNRCP